MTMNVELHIPAEEIEEIESKRTTTVETRTPTTLVFQIDVTENPNFDYYLQHPGEVAFDRIGRGGKITFGGKEYWQTDDCSLEFEVYGEDILKAAKIRAGEDHRTTLEVLEEWKGSAESYDYDDVVHAVDRAIRLVDERDEVAA